MSGESAIEWTDATWNPTTGCDKVSPGCDNCYAMTLAKRLKAMGSPPYQEDGDPRTSGPGFLAHEWPNALGWPLHKTKPLRIFVNSMSDLFHKNITDGYIARVFAVMAASPQHEFQVLTKRPGRMRSLLSSPRWPELITEADEWPAAFVDGLPLGLGIDPERPLDNVWLGVSVESADQLFRIDALRRTPAAVRFLSLEPLLGPLNGLDLNGIDWVIVGGESGPGARPMAVDWARSLRDQCVAAGVPFLFKQWGGRTPKAGGRELDGRTWDEYPTAADPSSVSL
jgi:protein gp37